MIAFKGKRDYWWKRQLWADWPRGALRKFTDSIEGHQNISPHSRLPNTAPRGLKIGNITQGVCMNGQMNCLARGQGSKPSETGKFRFRIGIQPVLLSGGSVHKSLSAIQFRVTQNPAHRARSAIMEIKPPYIVKAWLLDDICLTNTNWSHREYGCAMLTKWFLV
jgi:hypothetical protein